MNSPAWLRSLALLLALSALPAVAAHTPEQDLSALPAGARQTPEQELRREAELILERWNVPGAGLALVNRSGVVWAGGVGLADRGRKTPVTADTLFRTGSISKSFVSAVLLQLVEEGKVRLEDRLAALCPEVNFSNVWEDTDPVRLAHLLEHTAGFDDMHFNEWYSRGEPEPPLLDVLALNPRSRVTRWRPGTMPSYSNVGYGVAGYAIEKLAGLRFEEAVRRRLLEPLGMKGSSFSYTQEVRRRLAQGYDRDGLWPAPYRHILHRPAGSLHSSPRELGLFVQLLLNRGRAGGRQLLRPESVARMEVPRTTSASRAGLRAGYGLGNYFDVNAARTTHGHEGGIDGFLSSYAYLPELGVGYVALINTSHSVVPLLELKELMLRHALKLAGNEAGAETGAMNRGPAVAADAMHWTGTYRMMNWRNQILAFVHYPLAVLSVYWKDGRLWCKPLGSREPVELVPAGKNLYRLPGQTEASLVFFEDRDGRRVLAGGMLHCVEVGLIRGHAPWILLWLALLLMRSLLFARLIWIPLGVLGIRRNRRERCLLRLPLLAVLCLHGSLALLASTPGAELGTANWRTVGAWLLSWLFAALSALALGRSLFGSGEPVRRWIRVHALLVSLACCGVALYLWWWGVLGLRTWAW